MTLAILHRQVFTLYQTYLGQYWPVGNKSETVIATFMTVQRPGLNDVLVSALKTVAHAYFFFRENSTILKEL